MTNKRLGWVLFGMAFCCLGNQVQSAQEVSRAASSPAATARGDAMISTFLAREARSLDAQFLRGIESIDAWNKVRPRLVRELHSMLGLWPIPERTPLAAQVTGTLECDGAVVIEKLHFQSRPGLYVTANLYRPKTPGGPFPAVLYVCGHSSKGRDGCKTAYQDHGIWYARNGYVCLIVDTLQLGEIPGIHHGTYRENRWWWQATGYTPAGVECWNGIRAIDYLCSRSDVDLNRIGVTGISGGGAATLWIAAADQRVACAVPISGMSDLECYVGNKVINRHCDCMLMVNTNRWAWTTIAALVAPRPLLLANSDEDPYFPMDANRRIVERLRKLYLMAGMPHNLDDYVSHGGHADRTDLKEATYRWMNAHLKRNTAPVQIVERPKVEENQLRVFPEDRDLPLGARNATIDETFVPLPKFAAPDRAHFDDWKQWRLAALREMSFASFPLAIPTARPKPPNPTDGKLRWLVTEPGIEVAVLDLRAPASRDGWCTLIVLNEDESLHEIPAWARSVAAGGSAVLLATRGTGPTEWSRTNPPNYVARAHAILGRSVDQGRVRDVMATADWIASGRPPASELRLAGKGPAGIVAAYAAILGAQADEVVVIEPPASHRQGPVFLDVLRVLDIPEALGLLAPTPLRLVRARSESFRITRSLYERAEASRSFHAE
jgi:dienelactone hydrolase